MVGGEIGSMAETKAIPQVQYLPLYLLDPPSTPLRSVADQEKFDELVASIRQFGVLQPIGVTPKEDGRYEVIWGHLRYMAAMALKLDSVPCIVRHEKGVAKELLMLEENVARQEHNPLDEARFYRRLIDVYGLTVEEIAQKRGVTAHTIYNKLELLRMPEDVQKALEEGRIGQEHARAIAKLPDPHKREYYIRQVEQYGASTTIIRTWVQRELIEEGLIQAPPPQVFVEPQKVIKPGGGALCALCDQTHPPERVVGLFLCLEDYQLFQKFKEAYHAQDEERVEGV
jgi:ParB/RepB/Spo0J family partition protein